MLQGLACVEVGGGLQPEEEEQARVPIADMAAAETPLYRPQYELSMAFLILERLQPSQPTDYISAAHPA